MPYTVVIVIASGTGIGDRLRESSAWRIARAATYSHGALRLAHCEGLQTRYRMHWRCMRAASAAWSHSPFCTDDWVADRVFGALHVACPTPWGHAPCTQPCHALREIALTAMGKQSKGHCAIVLLLHVVSEQM